MLLIKDSRRPQFLNLSVMTGRTDPRLTLSRPLVPLVPIVALSLFVLFSYDPFLSHPFLSPSSLRTTSCIYRVLIRPSRMYLHFDTAT